LEQKHLLSVNLTEDKTNVYYDDTPFTAARLTPETRKAHEASADEVHKILMKGMKLPLLFAGYILIGIGLVVLCAFLGALPEAGFTKALQNGKWLLIGGAALAAVGGGLLWYHKKSTKRANDNDSEDLTPEEDASFRVLENTARQVQFELDLPDEDDLTEIELLPYHYKKSADGTAKESMKNGCFANSVLFFWKEEDTLCLTDYDCTVKVPVSAIEGYYTVNKAYKIAMWWKDEEYDKEPYAAYKIKVDNEGNYKLGTYYRVIIRDGEDSFEMRIPCYDFSAFQGFVDIPCLDGQGQI
jgi:hypothetical protein